MTTVERVELAYNNVYFVSDGSSLVVIDTGPDYRGAREAISDALRGRTPDIVVATHGHLDHAGLGKWWQERGCAVLLGRDDMPQTMGQSDRDIDLMAAYLEHIGAPEAIKAEAIAALEARRRWASEMRTSKAYIDARDGRWPTALRYEPFEPLRTITEPTSLACGLTALPSPGHTPGNLVVVQADEGRLFSGDQLLPEITPTPAIQFHAGARFASLPRFLESLLTLRAELPGNAHCFPGHGEPFANVDEVIRANLEQAEQRSARLIEELRQDGAITLYELAERMYPRALRRRFWQIVATIQGQLDVLEEAGQAAYAEGRWSI
ncbi:MAG: MBL fold metallo-hydrolase [Dehalococcoidia bacterium]|nr:MBL fold metallo-hydrolase [Dehalococcoidia bacterium]